MGLVKLVVAALAAAGIESSQQRNLKKQMNSPEVKRMEAERKYLYDPLPVRKGYNHVYEFDLAHKVVRDALEQMLEKGADAVFFDESVERNKDAWAQIVKEKEPKPYMEGVYTRYPDITKAYEYGWFERLEEIDRAICGHMKLWYNKPRAEKIADVNDRKAFGKSRRSWLYHHAPQYHKAGYHFDQYVMEYAWRSANNNGYLPSSQRKGQPRNVAYSDICDGRIRCFWKNCINWETGIPDQKARNYVKTLDQS